jgi:pyruvate formate lyase activating enzyme
MKKAFLFRKLENKKVQCLNCNHKCILNNNSIGLCGVRKNIDGILYNLIYNKIISESIDPIEKKPLYHFLPNTKTYSISCVGCNFKCPWCQNFEISQILKKGFLIGKPRKKEDIIKNALKHNCTSISYTYTEPTVWSEFIYEVSLFAKKNNLKNIWVTNGYFSKECLNYFTKKGLIDAMNIDLKSFNEKTYKEYCNADLKKVISSIEEAYLNRIHIEITTLIIPGVNDNLKEMDKLSKFIFSLDKKGEIPWHISRFFPAYKMVNKSITSIKILEKIKEIGIKNKLKYIYIGNVF